MDRVNELFVIGDAVCVAAPLLDPRTHAALALATLLVQRAIPDLTVTITPHTRDRAWLVDHCCNRIWLSATLPGLHLLAAFDAAARALHTQQRALAWLPRQRCCGDHTHSGLAAG